MATMTASGMQEALDEHLRRLDGFEQTILMLQASSSPASAASSSAAVGAAYAGPAPTCATVADLVNLVAPPPTVKAKTRIVFVDARPPNNRASRKFSTHFTPLESWCHFVFNMEHRRDGSLVDKVSQDSLNAVVFVCADGIASKCAANNHLRYHSGWEVLFCSTEDDAVGSFFTGHPAYLRMCRDNAGAIKKLS